MKNVTVSKAVTALMLAGLALLPLYSHLSGNIFILTLFTRIIILALAAASLNLIMGFAGLMSFGHAAYLGIGGYAVGMLAQEGIGSGFIQFPVAIAASAIYALVIGALSLRTRGVYFIMITLAFAQMIYFLALSTKAYGGDDGLSLAARGTLGGGLELANERTFYWATLALVTLALLFVWRLLNARFGHALQAMRENEARMEAVGFAVYGHRLVAFVIAGALAGLAGALLASLGGFVSPSMMQWGQSGLLMVMVILGGVGHLWGGVIGAAVFLLLEEVLSHYTIYWQFALGAALLAVVLAAPNGLMSLFRRKGQS